MELLIELTALQRLRAAWRSMPEGSIPELQINILDEIISRKEALRAERFEDLESTIPEVSQFM